MNDLLWNAIMKDFEERAARLDRFFTRLAELNRKWAAEDEAEKDFPRCEDCDAQLVKGEFCPNCDDCDKEEYERMNEEDHPGEETATKNEYREDR
jgi:hypothetical protein